jgi:hypothetical protein
MKKMTKVWLTVFENDLDAFVPELWAQESLMVLENNLVLGNLVHRDFENMIARFGDVVNTRRPGSFVSKRKGAHDNVTTQDATATNVPVPLDQHHHVSFVIYDGEESKGFKNLVVEYLVPAMQAVAQGIDEVIAGQSYAFLANSVGRLGVLPTKSTVIAARTLLTNNKAPLDGRNFVMTPNVEGGILDIADFTTADKVGDEGSAMREASIGRRLGFSFLTSQNMPSISAGNTVVTGAVNNSSGYAAGTTSITVDGLSAAITAGTWCTIAGDDYPQMITGSTGGSTPTAIVITPGLKRAVANDAVLTMYTPGAINLSAGYAAGWVKDIAVDAFSVAPQKGQLVTFGSGATVTKYGLLSTPTTTSILPSRPLTTLAANDSVVGIGPAGEYNFAFHRNALSLVTRPLATPMQGTGALSYVASYRGLSVRVTITYDGEAQGHRVTVDLLAGVATLDTNLGCVILG